MEEDVVSHCIYLNGVKFRITDLMKKTHFQVVLSVIMPPSKGPKTLEIAKTDETIAMYVAYFGGGTIKGTMIVDSA
jgi:hypothetical protein